MFRQQDSGRDRNSQLFGINKMAIFTSQRIGKVALEMIENLGTQFNRKIKLKTVGNFFQAKKDGMVARCLIFTMALFIIV